MRKLIIILLLPIGLMAQDSLKMSLQDLKEIRGRLIVCDSLGSYFDYCVLETVKLRNAIDIKEEEVSILRTDNKDLFFRNEGLEKALAKEKRRRKNLGAWLGAGIGAVVVVAVVSFLVK